jgi:hypothetical protein
MTDICETFKYPESRSTDMEKRAEEIPKSINKEIIRVLKKAQRLINKQDSKSLKMLSEETIKTASIVQDADSISLAVAIYAISKLLERWGYESEHADEIRNQLGSAQFSLEEGQTEEFRKNFKKVFEFIGAVDKRFREYIDKVIEKAEIKKGSRLYEQGISVGRSAELMGIGQWELMSYVGKTRISEEIRQATNVKQRIDFARSLFDRHSRS